MSYSTKPLTHSRHLIRASAVAGVLGLALVLGGCTSGSDSAAGSRDTSVLTAGEVKTSFGTYRQSGIDKSDPAWDLPDDVVATEVLAKYSREEVAEAWHFVLSFTAREGIDSALNGDGVSVDDWWADHKDEFHPDNRPEMLTSLEQGKSVVQREPWQQKDFEGYSYIYDSGPRVIERTITPDAAWLAGDGSIAFRVNVNYTMRVTPDIGTAGDGRQVTHGYMTYSARKTDAGSWGITSFLHDLRTFPG